MPNTLAHIGIQSPLSKLSLPRAPLQWILIGCIIPDLPWISQRIFTVLAVGSPLDLRLYSVTQASLAYCLLLSLALAMITRRSKMIFTILAGNSLLHLLLDACQKKWANGVNLLVPFSWKSLNFNLFWPEHFSSYLFAGLGLTLLLFLWPKAIHDDIFLQRPAKKKAMVALGCLLLYFASPVLLIQAAYSANVHYSQTLNNREERSGKELELDRAYYDATRSKLSCYMDNDLSLANISSLDSGIVSIRGHFLNQTTIEVQELHVHSIFRDLASYIGLIMTLLLWIHTLIHQRRTTFICHRNFK